jgi:hypothetical protein
MLQVGNDDYAEIAAALGFSRLHSTAGNLADRPPSVQRYEDKNSRLASTAVTGGDASPNDIDGPMLTPPVTTQTENMRPETIMDHHARSSIHSYQESNRRVQNPELSALQRQFPGVEITPWLADNNFRLVVATQAFDVQEVRLPDNTQMVRFHALAVVDFYVASSLPFQKGVAPTSYLGTTDGGTGLYVPRGKWFYCKGKTSLNIGILVNGYAVGVECFVQE